MIADSQFDKTFEENKNNPSWLDCIREEIIKRSVECGDNFLKDEANIVLQINEQGIIVKYYANKFVSKTDKCVFKKLVK